MGTQMGLLTAPTPFVTSRPHTLFHNREAYSSGSLGLAFADANKITVEVGVEPLTDEFTVTA